MGRDYAKVYTSIRDDDDFRRLSPSAQALYFQLIIGDITKAGTFWWRPKVFAAYFGNTSTAEVQVMMSELGATHFVLVDDDTDEGLVRSHVRYDGVMKSPNMIKSMVGSYRDLGSPRLRAVILNEVRREVERNPSLNGLDLLPDTFKNPSRNPSEVVLEQFPQQNPSPNPSTEPSGKGSPRVPHTGDGRLETGDPEDKSSGGAASRKRSATGARLPADWQPSEALREQMNDECPQVDLDHETRKFHDHWLSKTGRDATKLDWSATWRNWIRNARPTRGGTVHPIRPSSGSVDDQARAWADQAIRNWTPPPPPDELAGDQQAYNDWHQSERAKEYENLVSDRIGYLHRQAGA